MTCDGLRARDVSPIPRVMAVSLLASNGYRIAKSWQYEDNFPEPPSPPPLAVVPAAESSSDGGSGGLLQQCVARKESLEARRPLIDGSPKKSATIFRPIKDEDGYVVGPRSLLILSPLMARICYAHSSIKLPSEGGTL